MSDLIQATRFALISEKMAKEFLEEKKKEGTLHELFVPGILDELLKFGEKAVVYEALGIKGEIKL